MGIEVVIALAVLSAGFAIGVGLCTYWYWNFRKWLDQKLVSALKEKMLSELTDQGDIVVANQNTLFSWLYIAWWCGHKTEPTYTELLSYRLANNKTLAEFLVEASNSPENSHLLQQTCIQNLVLLWHTQIIKANEPALPEKLTWFQRLAKWLFTDSTPASWMVFDTDGFTEQTALKPLQDTMSKVDKNLIYKNKPTSDESVLERHKLPEKYTPQEQLDPNPLSALLHKSLDIDFSNQNIARDELTREQKPLTTVIELDLDQAMEHGQEQVIALNQTIDAKAELALEQQFLSPVIELDNEFDLSTLNQLSTNLLDSLYEKNFIQTSSMLKWILFHLDKAKNSKSSCVYISDKAIKMLTNLGDSISIPTYAVDVIAKLPLGFFIDEKITETNTVEYCIKFSKKLYLKQKEEPCLANLKADPFANTAGLHFHSPNHQGTHFKNFDRTISAVDYKDIEEALRKRQFNLSNEQLKFLADLSQSGVELVLRSELPKDQIPLKGKMYLEKEDHQLKYIVLTPENKVVEDILDIQVDEALTPDILKRLQYRILQKTSEKGHTHAYPLSKRFVGYRAISVFESQEYLKLRDVIFSVLFKIIAEEASTHSHVTNFLNALIGFEKTREEYQKRHSSLPCYSLLDPLATFATNYLFQIDNGTYFHSPEAMQYLERLAQNRDFNLFKLFNQLSKDHIIYNRPNFVQVARQAFYIYDYLTKRNIAVLQETDLYLLPCFPKNEDLEAYKNSHILVENELKYVTFSGQYEAKQVNMESVKRFLPAIAEAAGNKKPSMMHLFIKDAYLLKLITSNQPEDKIQEQLNYKIGDPYNHFPSSPESVMDCLVRIENKHPLLLKWMGDHLDELPERSLETAKKALFIGYSFIHRAMCLNEDKHEQYYGNERFSSNWEKCVPESLLKVSQEILRSSLNMVWKGSNCNANLMKERLEKGSAEPFEINTTTICLHKRAIFLRYVASQVRDDFVLAAIEKWENDVGLLSDHDPKFNDETWKNMVNYVLTLPNRIAEPVAEEEIKITKFFNPLIYLPEDIERLLKYLLEQDDTLNLTETKTVIEKLNAMIQPYGEMPTALLNAQALFRRISSLDKEKHPDKYQAVLTKLCETCYSLGINFAVSIENRLTPELASIVEKLRQKKINSELPFQKCKPDIAILVEEALKNNALKGTRQEQDQLAKDIGLIREMYHRLTYATSNKDPKEGKWLRLEQVAAIILGYTKQISQQIETSEGKTLIIGCTALLHALSGKQTDVLTHDSLAAESGANEFCELAYYFGVDVAFQSKPSQTVGDDIDIFYVDIGTAILADLYDKVQKDSCMQSDGIALTSSSHNSGRQTDVALIDEVDNIVIDIQVDTTMQISKGASKEADKDLLDALTVFKNWIEQEPRTQLLTQSFSKEKTIEAFSTFQSHVDVNQNYWTEEAFYFWLKAARLAQNLKRNEDYVIHQSAENTKQRVVYLVHKTTTGRVDKISKWGNGVHTYVSLCERIKQNDPSIVVPGLSKVIAKSDVITYLSTYPSKSAFSGTLGQEATTKKIKEIVHSDHVIKFPRAKRQETEEFAWPLVSTDINPITKKVIIHPKYSRAYHFPSMICESTDAQFERILQAVKNLQAQEKSCLILWNTITECENFSTYLMKNGIQAGHIQVFDDARDSQVEEDDSIRPTPNTIVNRAKEGGMITIGTAIAGRGIDFKGLSSVIIAKPGLGRVIEQKKGRGGRDFDFASIHEIYTQFDFPEFDKTFEVLRQSTEPLKQENNEPTKSPNIHAFFKDIATGHEQKLEENILAKLKH